jgi:hypothetical protein
MFFQWHKELHLANENLKIALSAPQLHNIREAYRRVYESLGTKEIDNLLRPEEMPIPKDPAIENMEALQMKLPKAFPEQDHDAHINAHRAFMATRMVQINPMVYALLQGHVSEHVSLKAQGEVGATIAGNPQLQQMMQEDPKTAEIQINAMIANKVSQLTMELAQSEAQGQQGPTRCFETKRIRFKSFRPTKKSTREYVKL